MLVAGAGLPEDVRPHILRALEHHLDEFALRVDRPVAARGVDVLRRRRTRVEKIGRVLPRECGEEQEQHDPADAPSDRKCHPAAAPILNVGAACPSLPAHR